MFRHSRPCNRIDKHIIPHRKTLIFVIGHHLVYSHRLDCSTITVDDSICDCPTLIRDTSMKMRMSWARFRDSLVATRKRKRKLPRQLLPKQQKKPRRKGRAVGRGKAAKSTTRRLSSITSKSALLEPFVFSSKICDVASSFFKVFGCGIVPNEIS